MAQASPSGGGEKVYPHAFDMLTEYVEAVKPELEFVLQACLDRLCIRVEEGHKKYGCFLRTWNGRDALQDAWEEAADLFFYMTQALLENDPLDVSLNTIVGMAQEILLLLTEQQIARESGIHGG